MRGTDEKARIQDKRSQERRSQTGVGSSAELFTSDFFAPDSEMSVIWETMVERPPL